MALAHNGMIRGLNSIYLQAPNIPSNDVIAKRDFLVYCQCWCESMHHHHDAEEAVFFPAIEQISGVKGLMAQNVEQHRAFTPGFEKFHDYAKTCQAEVFDGGKLSSLVEDFAEPLTRHLADEIETLKKLDVYDSAKVQQAYKRLEKVLMATDNVS
jgi:hemerythrin-like domain-containing protein